ncbi:MAG: cell division protein SepF [Armatimonadetes bacterium]|nr:cell division protein SepF [Armatimonadota bacterium]
MEELEDQARPGFFSRITERLFVRADEEEEYEDRPILNRRERVKHKPLQMRVAPHYHVTIRRQIVAFEDAMAAAQGLRQGEQQVINLTATEPGLRQKIIHFMYGVVFMADASWEEIGDNVYLVVPASANVESAPATPKMSAIQN